MDKMIEKVQYTWSKIKIWVKAHEAAKDADNYEGLTLKSQCDSKDEPRKEFKSIFDSLPGIAVQAMNCLDSWSDCDMSVHSVNFIRKDGDLAAVVLAGTVSITNDSTMTFKTPAAYFRKQEDKDFVTILPKSTKIIHALMKEVESYYQGDRAQAEMVLEDEAA